MKGEAKISVRRTPDQRQAIDFFQRSPYRVLLPRPSSPNIMEIAIANTSGGMVAGDDLNIDVAMGDKTLATVTSQAAEKAYRSHGPEISVEVNLKAGSKSTLKWMPQETILFDGVRLRRRISIHSREDARVLAGELLILGRIASGEILSHGLFHDEWRIEYEGDLIWADNLHLAGDIGSQIASPVGFDESVALATFVYVAADAPIHFDFARSFLTSSGSRVGATLIGNVIVVRWLGKVPSTVKKNYADFVTYFGSEVSDLPRSLPSVWQS